MGSEYILCMNGLYKNTYIYVQGMFTNLPYIFFSTYKYSVSHRQKQQQQKKRRNSWLPPRFIWKCMSSFMQFSYQKLKIPKADYGDDDDNIVIRVKRMKMGPHFTINRCFYENRLCMRWKWIFVFGGLE